MKLLLVTTILVCAGTQSRATFLNKLKSFSQNVFLTLPQANVSSACLKEISILESEVNHMQLWALKMIDASAKVPSGILNGNLNQFGDFDLCLASSFGQIKGQYCLSEISIEFKDFPEINEMIHAHRPLTSNISDPGQRIPKLNSWRWGMCLPLSCTAKDVENHLKKILLNSFDNLDRVEVKVSPEMCYTSSPLKREFGFYLTICLLLTITILTLLGTFTSLSRNKYLDCFSLEKNWSDLWKTESNTDEIDVVHGARVLSAIGLLLAHKQVAQLYYPFTNAVSISNTIDGGWTMIGRAAILYTDTFIIVSGLLTARSLLGEFQKKGKIDLKKHILTRYLRFTPNLVVVILISTYLLDHIGLGPQWGQVVGKYSDMCKTYMWRNFLYIHNFFGFEEMCLTHTHQLGLDMQLFLISPLLIFILWKHPKTGTILLTLMATLSTWLRYTVTLAEGLSTIVYYGISVDQLFKTARLSYILPTHRVTVYAIGIFLGYGYRTGKISWQMNKWQACLGWAIALMLGILAMFGPYHMAQRGYIYDAQEAAIYHAFSPIVWGTFVAWVAISCHNGKGGWFHSLLTWKYYAIFSRISYAFYLVQFPVFFYNVGIQRTSLYYPGFSAIIEIPEILVILFLSVALTLFVDMPFQNIRKALLNKETKTAEDSDDNSVMIGKMYQRHPRKVKFG